MFKAASASAMAALLIAGSLSAATGAFAQASPDNRLRIVTATFGKPGATRVRDFSDRLQRSCGDGAVSCESFCSKAMVGAGSSALRMPFEAHPVCRVVYRCGEGITRASETDEGDMLVLNCRQDHLSGTP
jgi:hypothetical protein